MRSLLGASILGLALSTAPAWADGGDDDGGSDDGDDDDGEDDDEDGCGDDDATTGASVGLGLVMLLGLRRRWE